MSNERGLKGTVTSKKDDICVIEITYTKEQASIIDETEKIIDVFIVLAVFYQSLYPYLFCPHLYQVLFYLMNL